MQVDPNRGTGRTSKIIEGMPNLLRGDRIFFVALTQQLASHARSEIKRIRGDTYNAHVDCRGVADISTWGRGIWNDNFVLDHSVWDCFSDLSQADQDFLMMLTTETSLGQFFDLKKSKDLLGKKDPLFTRMRRKLASWLMP